MRRRVFLYAAGAAALGRGARAADSTTLRIAVQTETSSLDPHFALVGANQVVAMHIFDPLVGSDLDMRPVPGLTTVANPQPDVWDFRVRDGAVFHDGSPVTAEALRFSIERMPRVPNSPAPFVRMQASIAGMELTDAQTLRVRTHGPDPSVPLNGMTAYIVPAREAATADFNAGRAAIGSGPWRFVSWQPGDALVLKRNEAWWGGRPDFMNVVMRPIANDAARLAALLAGDADLIDHVPQTDLPRVRENKAFAVTTSPSSRVIYIGLDQAGDSTPFVTSKDGKPLGKNPLRDRRVRQALSIAINRNAIAERVLQGGGKPTGQLAVPGQVGYDPALRPPAYDPATAKKLLAEAGYADGFRITLHSPNNRYVEDAKTVQAVAQFWSRIGCDARVEVMPSNVFFTRAGKREFSAFLIGFGHSAGDAWLGLSQVLQTYSGEGVGGLNRGRYSSPEFDKLMEEARPIADPARRGALLQQAQRVAFQQDAAILPLHVPDNVWAHRADITYEGGVDEGTYAHRAHLK
ncbi:MAG: ABC transporter substrate-binding protein [Acetobacteraceae bacterium]|nr:ABC transporter substrate-binding protein [Acetobacteraceae bacterium]